MFGINWKAPSFFILLVMLSILLVACGGRTKSASEPTPAESSQSQPTEAADAHSEGSESSAEEHADSEDDTHDASESDEDNHAEEGDAAASSDDHDEAD